MDISMNTQKKKNFTPSKSQATIYSLYSWCTVSLY